MNQADTSGPAEGAVDESAADSRGSVQALTAEIGERECVENALGESIWILRESEARERAAVRRRSPLQEANSELAAALTAQEVAEVLLAGDLGQKFRLLVDSVKDYAIFMLDPQGRVATWNSGAERIKGYSARDIIGRHFSSFYEESDVGAGLCEQELEAAAREGRVEAEGWRLRKNGSKFWANVVISALRGPDGELLGFAKVTRDLTDARKLEEERLRRAQAEEALRLRDEFLSIVSHELKTPLTVLQLQVDALGEQALDHDAAFARKLERARRSAQQLARLVDSLLDVARISANSLSLSPERLDLGEVVLAALEALREPAAAAGCELIADVERPIAGRWDRRRLEQVVTNLVCNAITYAAGAPVRISLSSASGQALLEVADRGPGIAAGDLERVFGRFERASSMRHYAGLGLGLYVVREIVQAHGGSVIASSAAQGGACFVVRLPIESATRAS